MPRLLLLLLALAGGANETVAQARWRLEEVARIGGGDEGLASFNDIRDLQLDAEGQVWVLDFQAKSLRLFGADGAPIKEVARAGAGPGEIRNANGFRIAPDGRAVLRDHSNNRLSIYDATGKHERDVTYPSFSYGWRLDAGIDRQGRFHDRSRVRVDTTYRDAVVRVTADFARMDTVDAPGVQACSPLPPPPTGIRAKMGFAAVPFAPRMVTTFAPSGAIWCASTDEYRVRRVPFGAKAHDLEVRLDVPRIAVPAAQRDSAIKGVEAFLERAGGAAEPFDKGRVPRDRGALLGFEIDDRDRLWVLRELRDGTAELDVWDAGRRVATLAPGFPARSFPLMRVRGDRLAIVLLDEDDLPTIFVYRIVTQ